MTNDPQKYVFSASTTSTSHVSKALKALNSVSSNASVTISSQGLKVSVDTPSRTCQAHVFFPDNLFTSYEFEESQDPVSFGIALNSLITCMQMFSQDVVASKSDQLDRKRPQKQGETIVNATCRFIYKGKGHPFLLLLSEGKNLFTRCEFTTFEAGDDSLGEDMIQLSLDNLVQKIIINGPIMADALHEMELVNTTIVTFRASSLTPPHFTIISHGPIGSSKLVFPNEKSVLETFLVALPSDIDDTERAENGNIVVTNSYQFENIVKVRDAVNLASRVSLRCDSYGSMSIQSMYEIGVGKQIFIDFRFLPSEEPQAEIYR